MRRNDIAGLKKKCAEKIEQSERIRKQKLEEGDHPMSAWHQGRGVAWEEILKHLNENFDETLIHTFDDVKEDDVMGRIEEHVLSRSLTQLHHIRCRLIQGAIKMLKLDPLKIETFMSTQDRDTEIFVCEGKPKFILVTKVTESGVKMKLNYKTQGLQKMITTAITEREQSDVQSGNIQEDDQ